MAPFPVDSIARLAGSDQFEHFRADETRLDSLPSDVIMTIFEDRQGIIWVGTYGGGLGRFDRTTSRFTHYQTEPGNPASMSGNQVSTIAEDPSGGLWIGTLGDGLNFFDRDSQQFRRFSHDPARQSSISSNEVLSLHMDETGTLWIGTQGGGLNRLRTAGDSPSKPPSNAIQNPTGCPTTWFTAFCRTAWAVFGCRRSAAWLTSTRLWKQFESFHHSDGLQADEFNMGASYRSQSGELLFGGVNGFNAFYPERVERTTTAPALALTSFLKLNEPTHLR